MKIIDKEKFCKEIKNYQRGVMNFSEEEINQMDSSHKIVEFSGEPEDISKEATYVIKNKLSIQGDTIYFILLANANDRMDKIMKAIPMDEIRSLNLKEKYGIYILSESKGNLPIKLMLIFK